MPRNRHNNRHNKGKGQTRNRRRPRTKAKKDKSTTTNNRQHTNNTASSQPPTSSSSSGGNLALAPTLSNNIQPSFFGSSSKRRNSQSEKYSVLPIIEEQFNNSFCKILLGRLLLDFEDLTNTLKVTAELNTTLYHELGQFIFHTMFRENTQKTTFNRELQNAIVVRYSKNKEKPIQGQRHCDNVLSEFNTHIKLLYQNDITALSNINILMNYVIINRILSAVIPCFSTQTEEDRSFSVIFDRMLEIGDHSVLMSEYLTQIFEPLSKKYLLYNPILEILNDVFSNPAKLDYDLHKPTNTYRLFLFFKNETDILNITKALKSILQNTAFTVVYTRLVGDYTFPKSRKKVKKGEQFFCIKANSTVFANKEKFLDSLKNHLTRFSECYKNKYGNTPAEEFKICINKEEAILESEKKTKTHDAIVVRK